jgi:hypothetical protein
MAPQSATPMAPTAPGLTAPPATDFPALTTKPVRVEPEQSSIPIVEQQTLQASVPATTKGTGTSVAKSGAPQIIPATKPATFGANTVATSSTSTIIPRQPSTPALDLGSLQQRLRDTRAIGVFAKLTLKNQVDDLLDEFRAFYKGSIKTPLTALRQRYDLLMMKVLTLLQDSDSALAATILSSREAIWGVLNDPKRFAQLG